MPIKPKTTYYTEAETKVLDTLKSGMMYSRQELSETTGKAPTHISITIGSLIRKGHNIQREKRGNQMYYWEEK